MKRRMSIKERGGSEREWKGVVGEQREQRGGREGGE